MTARQAHGSNHRVRQVACYSVSALGEYDVEQRLILLREPASKKKEGGLVKLLATHKRTDVPDFDRWTKTSRGESLTVGTKGHTTNGFGVSL